MRKPPPHRTRALGGGRLKPFAKWPHDIAGIAPVADLFREAAGYHQLCEQYGIDIQRPDWRDQLLRCLAAEVNPWFKDSKRPGGKLGHTKMKGRTNAPTDAEILREYEMQRQKDPAISVNRVAMIMHLGRFRRVRSQEWFRKGLARLLKKKPVK